MIIFELDLDFKYPSTQQLNFIDELESIGIRLKSVSSASKVYFDNEEIDPSEVITIANPVSGTHYFKNDLGTQIKCVFIAKQSSINFQPGKPDLNNYYTKPETDEAIEEAIEGIDLSVYYTKDETNNAIEEAIEGIDFPEPEMPEVSKIPQKNGIDGNAMIAYTDTSVVINYYSYDTSGQITSYIAEYSNENGEVPVVFTEPDIGLIVRTVSQHGSTVGESLNFPNKLLHCAIQYNTSTPPRNVVSHTGYSTVDGYVMIPDAQFEGTSLLVENVRGFINQERFNLDTMVVRNCGILASPIAFNNINHLVIDGELKYISNMIFSKSWEPELGTPCSHITFVGKGLLKSEFVKGNPSLIECLPGGNSTIEFRDITFNEFVEWCNANGIATDHIHVEIFNGGSNTLVFKDQTITDSNQTKLNNSYALVIATLEDGTVLPCRSTADYPGWVQVANAATTVEINSTGSIFTLRNANFFKNYNFNSVKEFTNKVNIAYAFKNALDKESATEQAYLAPSVDIKDAYLDSCGGAEYTLFRENRVIQNVYFKGIPSFSDVEAALGTQNADAKIYFAGVLAATYSGFYHELTWKNGFGPTTV